MKEYQVKRIFLFNLISLFRISAVVYACGKDMNKKYGLKHWNNSRIKTFLITCYVVLKNRTYVVYGDCNKVVATFSVARRDDALYFSKLAVFPAFAGTGIGSFCLSQIKNIAKSQNFEKLRCDVYEKSEHAVSFYFKHGFYLVGRKHTRKYDEMILEKQV